MTDLTLEAALTDARIKAQRLKHGRLHLWVERFDGCSVDWGVRVDVMTERDVRRLMEERPRGWRR